MMSQEPSEPQTETSVPDSGSREKLLLDIVQRRCDNDPVAVTRALENYRIAREACTNVFQSYNFDNVSRVFDLGLVGILPEISAAGNILILKLGQWDIAECSIYDIVAVITLLLEILSKDKERHKLGFSTVFDASGLKLAHLRQMKSTVRKELRLISKKYNQIEEKELLLVNLEHPAMAKPFCSLMNALSDGVKISVIPNDSTRQAAMARVLGQGFLPNLPVEYGGENHSWLEYSRQQIKTQCHFFLD